MTQVDFRPARVGDRDTLMRLISQFHDEHGDPIDPDTLARSVTDIIGGHTLVAVSLLCVDDLPVGYLALGLGYSIEIGGGDFFVDELYVEPTWRDRGIGKAAMKFAFAEARRLGARRVCLEVVSGNDNAHRLYEKLGFRGEGRTLLYRSIVASDQV